MNKCAIKKLIIKLLGYVISNSLVGGCIKLPVNFK